MNSSVRSNCKSRSILTASTKGFFCGIGRFSRLWVSSKSLRRSRRRCSRRSTQIDGFVLLEDRSLEDRQGLRGFPHEAFAELCKGVRPYSPLDRSMMLSAFCASACRNFMRETCFTSRAIASTYNTLVYNYSIIIDIHPWPSFRGIYVVLQVVSTSEMNEPMYYFKSLFVLRKNPNPDFRDYVPVKCYCS